MPEGVLHRDVQRVVDAFEARELHAARSGREVMTALASVIAESKATTLDTLAADLASNVDALVRAAPAYAPPVNAMHLVCASLERAQRARQPVAEFRAAIADAESSYQDWAEHARTAIARGALTVIPEGGVVFTFTLSETVLAALRLARKRGTAFKVVVTESRPNADGCMTARALTEEGLDVEVGIDAGVGELIQSADVMLIGAEALLSDGRAICKVGTYPSALTAKRSGVPVYVLVDTRKFYPASLHGMQPDLDRLRRADVRGPGAPDRVQVAGHLFDTTPAELITAVLTERGRIHPCEVAQWMLEMPLSDFVTSRLQSRAAGRLEETH